MRLSQFKKDDIIHRTKPIIMEPSGEGLSILSFMGRSNRAFIERPIIFLDIKSGLLFYRDLGESGYIQCAGLDLFDDESWDYFPTEYLGDQGEELKN